MKEYSASDKINYSASEENHDLPYQYQCYKIDVLTCNTNINHRLSKEGKYYL